MPKAKHSESTDTKAMFYSHDTFGLGHLRRTLTLASYFRTSVPTLSQLIVTGSPVANTFGYPPGTDYIKLPSVTKSPTGEYEPQSLAVSLDTIVNIRRDMLLGIAHNYQPDFFIVDHAPAGLRGEAVATLRHLKQEFPRTKLIVGLRDIMDEAAIVRRSWSRDGSYELFDDLYDLIMVYGNRDFYDVVSEYGLSAKAAAKTRFVGYLGREVGSRSRDEVRTSLGMQSDKLVVVTAGGGGDGKALYDAMLRDLHTMQESNFDCLIVGGPLLSDADRFDVRRRLGNRGNVHFIDFTDDLASYLGAADAVISMGGYNSVCEILSLGRPAIIVPRTKPRKEQLIRANVLSGQGLIDMIHPRDLTPERLLTQTHDLLMRSHEDQPHLLMNGLSNAMNAVGSLMRLPDIAQVGDPARTRSDHSLTSPHNSVISGR